MVFLQKSLKFPVKDFLDTYSQDFKWTFSKENANFSEVPKEFKAGCKTEEEMKSLTLEEGLDELKKTQILLNKGQLSQKLYVFLRVNPQKSRFS